MAPAAVRQAVGGGCRSGWGRLLSVTNAIDAGTWRQGDSGCAMEWGGGGYHPPFQCIPAPPPPVCSGIRVDTRRHPHSVRVTPFPLTSALTLPTSMVLGRRRGYGWGQGTARHTVPSSDSRSCVGACSASGHGFARGHPPIPSRPLLRQSSEAATPEGRSAEGGQGHRPGASGGGGGGLYGRVLCAAACTSVRRCIARHWTVGYQWPGWCPGGGLSDGVHGGGGLGVTRGDTGGGGGDGFGWGFGFGFGGRS